MFTVHMAITTVDHHQCKLSASVLLLFIINKNKTIEAIRFVEILLMFHSVDYSHFDGVNTNKCSHSEQQHNDRIPLFKVSVALFYLAF